MFFNDHFPEITVIVVKDEEQQSIQKVMNFDMFFNSEGKIMLLLLKLFSKNPTYQLLAEISTIHIFIDEFLCLPFEPSLPEINLSRILQFCQQIFTSKGKHIWIAPHLYVILTYATINKGKDKDIENFLDFSRLYPKTTLHTTMRTTKQVHDFMIQKKWQDFSKCNFTHQELNKIFCNNIFEVVFCNSHGHYITGPPVRIHKCDVTNPFTEVKSKRFLKFSAEVIRSEVGQYYTNYKVKPREIAVIIDTCDKDHILIKHSLINHPILNPHPDRKAYRFSCLSDPEYPNSTNIVAICNSDDIASFEWPVVIHIKFSYAHNYRFNISSNNLKYFESYHNMIASRCTWQYIIICCEGEDAWPQNKSFQGFKLWCEENKREFEAEAFHEYL